MAQSHFYRRTENKNFYERNFIELLNIREGNRQFLCKHAIVQVGTTWSKSVHMLNDFSLVIRQKDSGNIPSWKTNLSLEIKYIFLGHAIQEFKLWSFRTHTWIFSWKSLQHSFYCTCSTYNAFNSLTGSKYFLHILIDLLVLYTVFHLSLNKPRIK